MLVQTDQVSRDIRAGSHTVCFIILSLTSAFMTASYMFSIYVECIIRVIKQLFPIKDSSHHMLPLSIDEPRGTGR